MDDAKRKPLMARKPALVVAIGEKMDKKPESEGLTCPKCGHELADTPGNRDYVKSRAEEGAVEDEA